MHLEMACLPAPPDRFENINFKWSAQSVFKDSLMRCFCTITMHSLCFIRLVFQHWTITTSTRTFGSGK